MPKKSANGAELKYLLSILEKCPFWTSLILESYTLIKQKTSPIDAHLHRHKQKQDFRFTKDCIELLIVTLKIVQLFTTRWHWEHQTTIM